MTSKEAKELYKITCDIFERRNYQSCWFDDEGDCAPWQSCPRDVPDCPLVRLAGMCGFVFFEGVDSAAPVVGNDDEVTP